MWASDIPRAISVSPPPWRSWRGRPRADVPPSCWGHCHHILEQAVSHRAWFVKEREALLTMETGFLGKGHIFDVAVIRTP